MAEPAENATIKRLLANIDNTPAGATIRITGFSFSIRPVAERLVAASRRGVRVRVVLDDHSHRYRATRVLERGLGTKRSGDSFVVLAHDSARGTGGGTHQKTWSFSRTGASRWVVMVGSMNLTNESTRQFTDMYSFVGRRDVWEAFGDVFRHQVADRPMASPAITKRVGRHTAYFHPGFTAATDPVYRTLAGLPDRGTTIRISMYAWHHPRGYRLADLLAAKARRGAVVHFVEGPYVDDDITMRLRRAGVHVYAGPVSKRVHTKLTLVDYRDSRGRHRRVITGSDNFEDLSLLNDDVDLVLHVGEPVFRRYVKFFDTIVNRNEAKRLG